MYELLKPIILGLVQGLTEFLPVSSSGHLEIAKYLMRNDQVAEQSMMMTVVLHFATALSTVIVFRKDIMEIFRGLIGFKRTPEFWFCVKIVVSMVPAAVIGVFFEEQIEQLFGTQLLLIGSMLALTGVLLLLADRAATTQKRVGMLEALIIGVSQAIAILPGLSRSGATISTSVLLGIDRERAARFSFLMVVPLIFGKIAKDLLSAWTKGESLFTENEAMPLAVGFFVALVTGIVACSWMIRLVKSSKLYYFSIYCFVVAVLVIAESYFGFLAPPA